MPAKHRAGAALALWLTLLLPLQTNGATDPGLSRLQVFLDKLDTLTAEFTQDVVNRDQELVESAAGRVALQKPGRFRWDYQEPFERVIVADGERVWLYEADLDQASVWLRERLQERGHELADRLAGRDGLGRGRRLGPGRGPAAGSDSRRAHHRRPSTG